MDLTEMYSLFFKRFLDFVLAVFGFIVASPVFFITAIVLAVANKGCPFFFQERPGRNEKIFKIIKFKSMTDERDEGGKLLPDKRRLTKVGAFVRKTSIDEIPQLINIIKGDMSLVGPRPLLTEYLPFYTVRERKRHLLRPGVTGLAQVTQRNGLSWDEKLELDVEYVENLSFFNDALIIFKTIFKVLQRKDLNVLPSQYGTLLSIARANRYVLRPLEKRDLEYRVAWINDSRIHPTMNISTPITLDGTINWYRSIMDDPARLDLVLTHNDVPVAMSGVSGLKDGSVESYTFVDPEKKGQGLGSLAHFLRLAYVFEVFKAERVQSIIDVDNVASRKSVERFGFVLDSIQKDDLEKGGRKVDRCYYVCTPDMFNKNLYGYRIKGNHVYYTHQRG